MPYYFHTVLSICFLTKISWDIKLYGLQKSKYTLPVPLLLSDRALSKQRYQSVLPLSTRAVLHLYRSNSKMRLIYWQLGFSGRPIRNMWSSNLLPLVPLGDVGICVWLLLASISIVIHILHFKKHDPFFEEVSHFLELKIYASLLWSWKLQPTLQMLVSVICCVPQFWGIRFIYFQIVQNLVGSWWPGRTASSF